MRWISLRLIKQKLNVIKAKKMIMKTIYFLFALVFITPTCFAQDTIPEKVIRVDTVIIQQVRVDTVYIQAPNQDQTQPQSQQNQNDKVYYGGYANFSLGKYSYFGIEPLIGYRLLPKLSVGGKISYEYFKNKNYSPQKEGSNYGIAAFSRLRVAQRLYAHIEYSEMNYKIYKSVDESKRQWISFLYLGGGYSLPITKNASLNAEVLWDILQDDDSPYKTVEPFYNIGIAVGF